MQIKSNKENNTLTVFVSGRVDTMTAPELEAYINENCDGISALILDIGEMPYISSAGLRVLLKANKLMSDKGTLKIVHTQPDVLDILEMTGFTDIFVLE